MIQSSVVVARLVNRLEAVGETGMIRTLQAACRWPHASRREQTAGPVLMNASAEPEILTKVRAIETYSCG